MNKKNILIADDSNFVLKFFQKKISNKYNLFTATNGIDTISILKNNSIHALILDLNMPISNGFEVLEYLKNNNFFEHFPVIIIITGDDYLNLQVIKSYPILNILKKPFNEKQIDKILKLIDNFFDKNIKED